MKIIDRINQFIEYKNTSIYFFEASENDDRVTKIFHRRKRENDKDLTGKKIKHSTNT